MKYAWVENEKIRDICQGGNPTECYTFDVAANYTVSVPDDAKNGDGYVDGEWIPAPVPTPSTSSEYTWDAASVRAELSLGDKTKWDNDSTPEIVTAKIEFQTPQRVTQTMELLTYLVDSQSITQASMDKVLSKAPAGEEIPTRVATLP